MYVYFLKKEGKLYIGSTNNLRRRIKEHQKRSNYKLLSYIVVSNEKKARELEKYFKTGSGRAFLKKRILTDEASA